MGVIYVVGYLAVLHTGCWEHPHTTPHPGPQSWQPKMSPDVSEGSLGSQIAPSLTPFPALFFITALMLYCIMLYFIVLSHPICYLLSSCHETVSSQTADFSFVGGSIPDSQNSTQYGFKVMRQIDEFHSAFSWTMLWLSWVISLLRLYPFIIIIKFMKFSGDLRNKRYYWTVGIWNCWLKSSFLYLKKYAQVITTLRMLALFPSKLTSGHWSVFFPFLKVSG